MGKKIILYVLCVLFFVSFGLTIYGYINRNNSTEPTKKPKKNIGPINTTAIKVDYNNSTTEIDGLNDKLSGYELVKANKDYKSGYINAVIEDNIIKVTVQKTGLKLSEDETEVLEYKIEDITHAMAVQAIMMQNEGNLVKVYVLCENDKLYAALFNAHPDYYHKVVTYEYNIEDVESFITLTLPLTSDTSFDQVYVIFKTSDGAYYTDYQFVPEESTSLTKIVNKEVAPVPVEEKPETEGEQVQ